jgi:hypothetical protein
MRIFEPRPLPDMRTVEFAAEGEEHPFIRPMTRFFEGLEASSVQRTGTNGPKAGRSQDAD